MPAKSLPLQVAAPKPETRAAKKPKPSHPNTADMVNSAIRTLAERHGSSLHAIKKFMTTTYKVDVDKLAVFIRKYLKSAVAAGSLVQTKGKGASGSFKLPAKRTEGATVKRPAREATAAKKTATGGAKGASKTPDKASKAKSLKAKKGTKAPTAKPKAPKPKRAAGPKAKPPAKKTAAGKK